MTNLEPLEGGQLFTELSPYDLRQSKNDGLDAFGREIKVGDLLLFIEKFSAGKAYFAARYVDRVGFGKEGKSVSVKHSDHWSYPVRYSGRSIILERANG